MDQLDGTQGHVGASKVQSKAPGVPDDGPIAALLKAHESLTETVQRLATTVDSIGKNVESLSNQDPTKGRVRTRTLVGSVIGVGAVALIIGGLAAFITIRYLMPGTSATAAVPPPPHVGQIAIFQPPLLPPIVS